MDGRKLYEVSRSSLNQLFIDMGGDVNENKLVMYDNPDNSNHGEWYIVGSTPKTYNGCAFSAAAISVFGDRAVEHWCTIGELDRLGMNRDGRIFHDAELKKISDDNESDLRTAILNSGDEHGHPFPDLPAALKWFREPYAQEDGALSYRMTDTPHLLIWAMSNNARLRILAFDHIKGLIPHESLKNDLNPSGSKFGILAHAESHFEWVALAGPYLEYTLCLATH